MIRKGNVTIGLQTRFRPDWTGIRCGARTKLGGECQRPAVKKTGQCTRYIGKSTGPRTQAGRKKIAELHTTHGKYTKAKRQAAQKRAEVGRIVFFVSYSLLSVHHLSTALSVKIRLSGKIPNFRETNLLW